MTILKNRSQFGRHLIVAVFVFMLLGCGKSDEEMRLRLTALEATVQELHAAHQRHHSVLDQLSQWEQVAFQVNNIRFDVVEKAFEPLIAGEAELKLVGDAIPDLIFVEWEVTVDHKGQMLEPVTYIQRVEKGEATLRILHPLPSHEIRKKDIRLQVKPTSWYLAHVAQIAE